MTGDRAWTRAAWDAREASVKKRRLRRSSQKEQLDAGEEPAHRAGETSVSVGTQPHVPLWDRLLGLRGCPSMAGGTDVGNGAQSTVGVKYPVSPGHVESSGIQAP